MEEPRVSNPLTAPSWLTVAVGVLLVPFTLLCLAASLTLVFAPPPKSPALSMALGAAFVFICLWALFLGVRLMFNRRASGGLMGPTALRLSALLFASIPAAGLFTGWYQQHGLIAVCQAAIYIAVAGKLWSLARRRSRAA